MRKISIIVFLIAFSFVLLPPVVDAQTCQFNLTNVNDSNFNCQVSGNSGLPTFRIRNNQAGVINVNQVFSLNSGGNQIFAADDNLGANINTSPVNLNFQTRYSVNRFNLLIQ